MATEVTDSSDWLETRVASLAAVDSALRCQVCKELLESPMITTCEHTFCSLCIRRCLSNDGKCPLCRTDDQPKKLRKNNAMEEVVQAFKKARPEILQLGREIADSARSAATNKRKRKAEATVITSEQSISPRKTRLASRNSSQRSYNPLPIELADSEEEEEVTESITPAVPEQISDGLVPCPVCQRRMKEETVYTHLDICTGAVDSERDRKHAPSLGKTATQNGGPRPEPLPGLNYSILNETALRKKIDALNLPTQGNKAALQRRHAEWVNIWNANCDSTHPRSNRELLRDLAAWEKSQFKGSATKSSVMDKDFDGKAWASSHNDDFADLIRKAREKRKPPASGDDSKDQPKESDLTKGTNGLDALTNRATKDTDMTMNDTAASM